VSRTALQCLPDGGKDGERLAAQLGVPVHEIAVHRFPDGELRVTAGPAAATTIIYAPLHQPNEKLLAILFAAEALRREGTKRLVLVAPYLCYMRQDAAFHGGEAISQRVVGALLARTVDRVITVDAHLHRTNTLRGVFPGIEADNLAAMPIIADALQATSLDPATVVVGPDAESRQWVSDLAGRLGLAHLVAQKKRHSDRSVSISFADPAIFAGRPVLLVDDIASSGGTLISCAQALAEVGAMAIDVIVTHALFPADTTDALLRAGIRSVRSTHTVPHPTNAIRLDGILAAALRAEIGGEETA
jgi:ribose-phosphate pyrophosphokinase